MPARGIGAVVLGLRAANTAQPSANSSATPTKQPSDHRRKLSQFWHFDIKAAKSEVLVRQLSSVRKLTQEARSGLPP